jgi:hypothetical protein
VRWVWRVIIPPFVKYGLPECVGCARGQSQYTQAAKCHSGVVFRVNGSRGRKDFLRTMELAPKQPRSYRLLP